MSKSISATFFYGNHTYMALQTEGYIQPLITRAGKTVVSPSKRLVETAMLALKSEENGISG